MSTNFQENVSAAPFDQPTLPPRFLGKVAVITGASLQGIGGAIAMRLAREGATLCLLCKTEPTNLIEKLAELERGVQWTCCDVTSVDEIDRARDACLDEFGRLDVLVNNAGIETMNSFEDTDDDQWQELLDVNLTGVMRVSRSMLTRS